MGEGSATYSKAYGMENCRFFTPSYWPGKKNVVRTSESSSAIRKFLPSWESGAAAFLSGVGPFCLRIEVTFGVSLRGRTHIHTTRTKYSLANHLVQYERAAVPVQ